MIRRQLTLLLILLLPLALLAACAPNPADDVPAAETADAPAASDEAASADAADDGEAATVYVINGDNSDVTWVGSKVTGSHDGGFNQLEGTVEAKGTPESIAIDLTIDTTSIYSDDERLTEHLKSEDFFEVETYPTATFVSSQVVPGDGVDQYKVTGELTLHGTTKQITFPATISVSPDVVQAQAEFSIMRFDYGIEYKGRADDLIRDEVVVRFDVNAEAAGVEAGVEEAGATEMVGETPGGEGESAGGDG